MASKYLVKYNAPNYPNGLSESFDTRGEADVHARTLGYWKHVTDIKVEEVESDGCCEDCKDRVGNG